MLKTTPVSLPDASSAVRLVKLPDGRLAHAAAIRGTTEVAVYFKDTASPLGAGPHVYAESQLSNAEPHEIDEYLWDCASAKYERARRLGATRSEWFDIAASCRMSGIDGYERSALRFAEAA